MINNTSSSIETVLQTKETKRQEIWKNVRKSASILTILALLSGGGLFGCTKPKNKDTSPVSSKQEESVASDSTIKNPIEKSTEDSTTIIIHAGGKTETTGVDEISEKDIDVVVASRAEQIYQEILKEGGYIPNALKNNVRSETADISSIFASINGTTDSPLVKQDGHTYLGVGHNAMLYIHYNARCLYRTGIWKDLTAGILHFNITDMPAGAAVHSFDSVRNISENKSLMPNTLVDLIYVEDPTKNIVYNTTTFMEEVLTSDNQVVAHMTQFADLDGDGKFERSYEGYSLPMSRDVGVDDLLILASANGINHELYELYHNSTFEEVLEKAPEQFETETATGTYEYKLVMKTPEVLYYKLTRESYEKNRGKDISAEQKILNMSFNWIPYQVAITTNGRICQATYTVGQDWGSEMMYGKTFSDGEGDGLFRWANTEDPRFKWVNRIPGVIQYIEADYQRILAD